MDIISIFEKKVSSHKFQKVISNCYEQGNDYNNPVLKDKNKSKNEFVKITKNVGKNRENNLELQSLNSIFEKIAFIYENGVIIDFEKYKQVFYDSLSDSLFKVISKRHQILKRDIYAFVYEKEIILPSNKDIMKLLTNIININIVICVNKKEYLMFKVNNINKTLLICIKNIDVEEKIYDSLEQCEYYLNYKGFKEYKNYKELKLIELKEYAKFHNIEVISTMKKADIIEIIEKSIKN